VKVKPSRFHLHYYSECLLLSDDFSYLTSTYGTATFTDSETKTFVHRDWSDQIYFD